jgi:hypothetical protein
MFPNVQEIPINGVWRRCVCVAISVDRATETATQTELDSDSDQLASVLEVSIACLEPWPDETLILRGWACGTTGIRRLSTPSV